MQKNRTIKKGQLRFASSVYALMLLFLATGAVAANGWRGERQKMSSMVRWLSELNNVKAEQNNGNADTFKRKARRQEGARLTALVRLSQEADGKLAAQGAGFLAEEGVGVLDSIGDIYIVSLPVASLPALVADSRVERVEAESVGQPLVDVAAASCNVTPVSQALNLPKAYKGKGVVMGVMDVGFDLTHPNFLDASGSHSRIRRFWDQLSLDTIGSSMPVGAEYTTPDAIAAYAHSRDGLTIYHGTHTLGIAAGNGASTPYVGMAPESDICIVSNAVDTDADYIDEADLYRYTTATDLLGFKYIFDYAASEGKPCVVSFSEGSPQDFDGDNELYYEALSRLTGEGRILVASAGNTGGGYNYLYKPSDRTSAGAFLSSSDKRVHVLVKSRSAYALRTRLYRLGSAACSSSSPRVTLGDGTATIRLTTSELTSASDSTLSDTIFVGDDVYVQTLRAYPSCYDRSELVVDASVSGPEGIGNSSKLSIEMEGGAEAELFRLHGKIIESSANPDLKGSDHSHGLLSPGSAPGVICVGSTNNRTSFVNEQGNVVSYDYGPVGERSSFSAVGPTFDGRHKPDVMAPGANVVSSMSSFYMEHNPDETEIIVRRQTHDGRVYGWVAETGTSMSAPIVGGIVALWLEANPRLTPQNVMDIMARTSHPCGDYGDNTADYCGYGTIDAYAGLLDILGLSSVESITPAAPQGVGVRLTAEGTLRLLFSSAPKEPFHLLIYDSAGTLRQRKSMAPGESAYEEDLSALPKGVYVVQIDTGSKSTTGSVIVRR